MARGLGERGVIRQAQVLAEPVDGYLLAHGVVARIRGCRRLGMLPSEADDVAFGLGKFDADLVDRARIFGGITML